MALIPPLYKPEALRLKIAEKLQLTHDVWEFYFEPIRPSEFKFEPGQFININIPSTEKRVVRSYSIASNPIMKKNICICVKLIDGPGSLCLSGLKIGDEVSGNGPLWIFSLNYH